LDVYNIRGEWVCRLVDDVLPQGVHTIRWDGRNHVGHSINAGVYVLSLAAGKQEIRHKVLYIN